MKEVTSISKSFLISQISPSTYAKLHKSPFVVSLLNQRGRLSFHHLWVVFHFFLSLYWDYWTDCWETWWEDRTYKPKKESFILPARFFLFFYQDPCVVLWMMCGRGPQLFPLFFRGQSACKSFGPFVNHETDNRKELGHNPKALILRFNRTCNIHRCWTLTRSS